MRKKVFGRKLSRDRGSRNALRRSLIRALVEHGKITTTLAKAKAVQPDVEKIMTAVRENTVAARRRVLARLGNDVKTTNKLFKEYLTVTDKRNSGYTRIVKLPARKGDLANMSILSFVDQVEKKPAVKKEEVKKEVKKTESKKK